MFAHRARPTESARGYTLHSVCPQLYFFPFILSPGSVALLSEKLHELDLLAEFRSCTGVLASHRDSRDLKIQKVSMRFYGVELLQETEIILNVGRRYGLIGFNGCGKFLRILLEVPFRIEYYCHGSENGLR